MPASSNDKYPRNVALTLAEAECMVENLRAREETFESETAGNLLARLEYYVKFWRAGVEI